MTYRGRWALVTGASAGLGEAFAAALARRGANLILTARREDRLARLAERLASSQGVETVTIRADLSDPGAPEQIFDEIAQARAHVDILVSNAGHGEIAEFEQTAWAEHRAYLELMVIAHVRLAHLALPFMKERGYGRILNVASLAGFAPATAGVYGATKSFLISFSEALAAQCAGSGVKVSASCPGLTYTEFHDVAGTRAFANSLPKVLFQEPTPVVEGSLKALESGSVVYIPGPVNKAAAAAISLGPRGLVNAMAQWRRKRA